MDATSVPLTIRKVIVYRWLLNYDIGDVLVTYVVFTTMWS
jgi:hypothetical protein